MTIDIHPTAIVGSEVQLGNGVKIHAFAIVENGVVLGDNCEIRPHAIVRRGAMLEDSVKIDSFSVIAGDPQDLSFDLSTETGVTVGARTVIREAVTIHRATTEGSNTEIGKDCLIMGGVHMGHDISIGNHVILANYVKLAGHILIEDHVFMGGGSGAHQFVNIGTQAMIAGHATITYDVPPYITAAERNMASGLNLIGLKRRGFDKTAISDIRACYRAVYMQAGNPVRYAIAALESGLAKTNEGKYFLEFFTRSRRSGFVKSRRQTSQ